MEGTGVPGYSPHLRGCHPRTNDMAPAFSGSEVLNCVPSSFQAPGRSEFQLLILMIP